jgi:uncharacterized protein
MSELIDNRAQRVRQLKEIIKHLHAGKPASEVKSQLEQVVRATDYSEVVAMEQELLAEGMPVEELRSMCDLHSQVTRDLLVAPPPRTVPPGHPVDTFRRENEALRGVLLRMRIARKDIEAMPEAADCSSKLFEWRQAYNELMDVEKHYQRKEHCLFPALEAHGITGPPKVMWAKHDDTRALLKDLGLALKQPETRAGAWKLLSATAGAAAEDSVEEMIYKEENILLPMALGALTEEDWAVIFHASPRYGWCLVEPQTGYTPPAAATPAPASGGIQLPTGNVSIDQLTALFNTLPFDLTFVDADDRVAFFSEGPQRVFARSRAVLGRKVQHCHPPKSVDVVDRIVGDFRAGRQNVAEFWINFLGRFVHIRYLAVRDEQGQYLGTLEVTQDVGPIRALEGERRLLEYDSPEVPAS